MKLFVLFMENHFVYIIYSEVGDCYYRGYSQNPKKRLQQHNNQESKFTSKFSDWRLVYVEKLVTKRDALIREKGLKKYSKAQIKELILLAKNCLDTLG